MNIVVILGPTAVGKTEVAVSLAKKFQSPIVSADSRQMYKELPIGTAAPSDIERNQIKHYFVGNLSVIDDYNAGRFEYDALALLAKLHQKQETIIVCGGSMLYLDALCRGISDDIPDIDVELRSTLLTIYEREGIYPIRQQLKILDPAFYRIVDLKNHRRVIHALEICLMTGKPYSQLRNGKAKKRSFRIFKIGLQRNREELYMRIHCRVDQMIKDGLIKEARKVYSYKNRNALNTVGYKELFHFFEGKLTLDIAVEKIKQNTRIYSRKQMAWFKKATDIIWFHPNDILAKANDLHDTIPQFPSFLELANHILV